MGLPGISRDQMIEVDRIMMEELSIPVELMMENAGSSFARLAVELSGDSSTQFLIVVGSGNNGGGGLVAARRLFGWGYNVKVVVPKGIRSLRSIPRAQLERLKSVGSEILEGPLTAPSDNKTLVLDAFIGYGFTRREDPLANDVFAALKESERVLSLDAPSGLDVTTGENVGRVNPLATLTIAFVKSGLLETLPESLGDLYVCDIGVPSSVFRERLGINWTAPYSLTELDRLYRNFRVLATQRVRVTYSDVIHESLWTVEGRS